MPVFSSSSVSLSLCGALQNLRGVCLEAESWDFDQKQRRDNQRLLLYSRSLRSKNTSAARKKQTPSLCLQKNPSSKSLPNLSSEECASSSLQSTTASERQDKNHRRSPLLSSTLNPSFFYRAVSVHLASRCGWL